MQQQIAVITLGVDDPARARKFYADGFGWTPVFEMDDIAFFQMNGLVLGLWDRTALAQDCGHAGPAGSGSATLAHNVSSEAAVDAAIERLVGAGATLLRAPDAPPHGGYRGYVRDPDGHVWEIAWNPAWPIDAEGRVTFAT